MYARVRIKRTHACYPFSTNKEYGYRRTHFNFKSL